MVPFLTGLSFETFGLPDPFLAGLLWIPWRRRVIETWPLGQ